MHQDYLGSKNSPIQISLSQFPLITTGELPTGSKVRSALVRQQSMLERMKLDVKFIIEVLNFNNHIKNG